MRKKYLFLFYAFLIAAVSFAQQNPQKFALVIGNGAYTNITKLNNPVNDANDMTAALRTLGFSVDTVLNGNLEQMESAIMRLKKNLSTNKNSYGFLFYAGHGVQSSGENYLIPVNANIQSENFLRRQAIALQEMLDELNDAGNELNVVVLDACRDNPFGWNRGSNRGLTLVANQPADSIIVYSTSAGSVASDGTGRNGLFTEQLLKNLKTQGLDVHQMLNQTMGDVRRASNDRQRPAIYNQFPGLAYLGTRPAIQAAVQPVETIAAVQIDPAPADQTASATPALLWNNPFISPDAGWSTNSGSNFGGTSSATFNIYKESIEYVAKDLINIMVFIQGRQHRWGGIGTAHYYIVNRLKQGSGLKFKALGDGRRWFVEITSGNNSYRSNFSTTQNKVADINIPYTKFRQAGGKITRFDKTQIQGLSFLIDDGGGTASITTTLKIFDLDILP